jgi:hypothetical protein
LQRLLLRRVKLNLPLKGFNLHKLFRKALVDEAGALHGVLHHLALG